MLIVCPHCNASYKLSSTADFARARCKRCRQIIYLDGSATDEFVFARGQEISGYRILEVKAVGGMGAVYKALQLNLQRVVALKTLPRNFVRNEKRRKRFEAEIAALAALAHPHIISIYDKGEAENVIFYTMEYVNGPSVRELLRSGPISVPEVTRMLNQMLAALEYLHKKDIIHRDIKPGNILVDESGNAKLTDFGIIQMRQRVQMEEESGEAEEQEEGKQRVRMLGTPSYMAPEQKFAPETVDGRADLYSLGRTCYEMFTGSLPAKFYEPASKLNANVPPALDEVLDRALKAKPEERFASAREFADALQDAAATDQAAAQKKSRKGRGMLVALIVGVLFLLVAAGSAGYMLFARGAPEDATEQDAVALPHEFVNNRRLGRLFQDRGDLDAAIAHYNKALAAYHDEALQEELKAMMKVRQEQQRREASEQANRQRPVKPKVDVAALRRRRLRELHGLAETSLRKKEWETARTAIADMLKIEPANAEAQKLQDQLRQAQQADEVAVLLEQIAARASALQSSGSQQTQLTIAVRDWRVLAFLLDGRNDRALEAARERVRPTQGSVLEALETAAQTLNKSGSEPSQTTGGYFDRMAGALAASADGIKKRIKSRSAPAAGKTAEEIWHLYEVQCDVNHSAIQDAAAAAYCLAMMMDLLDPKDGQSSLAAVRRAVVIEDGGAETASEQLIAGLRLVLVRAARYIQNSN